HTEADTPVGFHGGLDLRERIGVHLDDVVEEPHGEPYHPLELVPVEPGAPVRGLAREARDVNRAEVARVVRRKWLLSTGVSRLDRAQGRRGIRAAAVDAVEKD